MSDQVLQLLGSSIFPTIVGMAFVGLRKKPQQQPMPGLTNGGFVLFLKTWAVTFICALVFGLVLTAVGTSESFSSGFGHLVFPAVCAFHFARSALTGNK